MSYFGKNVKKIRGVKNLSQTAFSELFNLSRASIGAYEEGRAEAKLDTIIQIANYFSITVDELVNKELTVNDLYHFDSLDTDIGKSSGTNIFLEKIDLREVTIINSYQFLTINETDFSLVKKSERLHLPNIKVEKAYALSVNNKTITVCNTIFNDGDFIVFDANNEWPTPNNIDDSFWLLQVGKKIYLAEILLLKTAEIILYDKLSTIKIKVLISEVSHIHKVIGHISQNVKPMLSDKKRLLRLEEKLG